MKSNLRNRVLILFKYRMAFLARSSAVVRLAFLSPRRRCLHSEVLDKSLILRRLLPQSLAVVDLASLIRHRRLHQPLVLMSRQENECKGIRLVLDQLSFMTNFFS